MRIKIIYLITILVLLISCNQEQKQIDTWNNRVAEYKTETYLNSEKKIAEFKKPNIVVDTITNWQLYKDSELLFKSNILDSNRFTGEIKTSDKYEYLIFQIFYDFNNEIIKREIQLSNNEKVIATFVDENRSRSPFRIEKYILDRIRIGNVGKEIKINYSDSINKDGITIGILKFVKE